LTRQILRGFRPSGRPLFPNRLDIGQIALQFVSIVNTITIFMFYLTPVSNNRRNRYKIDTNSEAYTTAMG